MQVDSGAYAQTREIIFYHDDVVQKIPLQHLQVITSTTESDDVAVARHDVADGGGVHPVPTAVSLPQCV